MQKHNLNTNQTTLYIKNMVSNSCIKLVKQELERTGFIDVIQVTLGEAVIRYDAQVFDPKGIDAILKRQGFELIDNTDQKLVQQIKSSIIQLIFYGSNTNSILRNSDYLSEKLGHPYQYLSKIFSAQTGSTLEKYIILIKTEKIKELISYEEITLSEIAYRMGYSSVQYLSNQFKQVTGFTVSDYKGVGKKNRTPLSDI